MPITIALSGRSPLPWWSGGWYAGDLRQLLLQQRRQPERNALQGPLKSLVLAMAAQPLLQQSVEQQAQRWQQLLLVPIPSCSPQPNPVPELLARLLAASWSARKQAGQPALPCRLCPELLRRRGPVASQLQLGRRQRWRNQWLSFCSLLPFDRLEAEGAGVLLVDDVLTSGATAMAAQQALQRAGWSVAGLLCLARTPRARQAGAGTR